MLTLITAGQQSAVITVLLLRDLNFTMSSKVVNNCYSLLGL